MKADLTRNTFSPLKHFTRVLMQQGRVQLDADWNEQTAILLRYLQALAADLIGPHGGPVDNEGFAIAALPASASAGADFQIGSGHYYVDGILCEVDPPAVSFVVATGAAPNTVEVAAWTLNGVQFQSGQRVEVFDDVRPPAAPGFTSSVVQIKDAAQTQRRLTLATPLPSLSKAVAPRIRHVVTYMSQPDYPVPSKDVLTAGSFQAYLDVWERPITYVEDDSIREVALGGPDTAARAKVVWQVKVTPTDSGSSCLSPEQLEARLHPNPAGRLRAMAKQDGTSADPCTLPPDARYRGTENQLYRVEIHRSGPAWNGTDGDKANAATVKWSRDNGSVVFPIINIGANTVVLETLGRDDHSSLSERDWVEVQDDDSVLLNQAGTLLQVEAIDRPSMTVTLNAPPDGNVGRVPSKHPLLRRWNQQEGDQAEGGLQLGSDGAALVVEDAGANWLVLENGVQIQFAKPDAAEPVTQYRTADYWLIPARTATGDVEWPTEMSKDAAGATIVGRLALPPEGVRHHYAPLAVVTIGAAGNISNVTNCRKKFSNVVELTPQ